MIVSTTCLIPSLLGLYEWPDDGLIIDGTYGALYLELTSFYYAQTSSMGSSRRDCFFSLLSYLGLGSGVPLDLNLSGSRGFLILSVSSSTTSVDANWDLIFSVCCYEIFSINPETSIFLFHFFLFCFPFKPLILMRSVMLVNIKLKLKITTIYYNFDV